MAATETAPAAARASSLSPAAPMQPEPFEVRQVAKETGDTFTLTLVPVAGAARPFAPGQFNMLYVFGVGEVPISISGDPARPERLVHTIRAVGATTRALQRLRKGDRVGVRGPFGSAWPVGEAHGRDVVLIAGGIGLAPLRPAIRHVLLQRARYGHVVILYGARTPRDILYARELAEWRSRFDASVEVSVDRATAVWQGSVGVVTKLVQRSAFDPQSAHAFICGPEVMMRYAAIALEQRGMPDASIFVSIERNMKCALGVCGHCQFGPFFVCKDGPVFRYDRINSLFGMREV
jgi:NAD(P)H-flavin reductase